jgi:hypothetical protein
MLEHGGRIKRTPLTAQFDLADHNTAHDDRVLPLLMVRGGKVHIFTAEGSYPPNSTGWTVISLVAAAEVTHEPRVGPVVP